MRLFGRRNTSATSATVPGAEAEVAPTEQSLARIAAGLALVEQALGGSSDRVYSALRELAEICGGRKLDTGELVKMEMRQPGAAGRLLNQPWLHLAATATHATCTGADSFTPRVYLFALWWTARFDEARRQAEVDHEPYHIRLQSDTLLGPPPDEAYAEIAAAALASLSRLPVDQPVSPLAVEQVLVGPLLGACARDIVALDNRTVAVPPQALRTAREMLTTQD